MKVLHVNVVYGYGSTGKIVSGLHHYLLGQEVDSVVYYGRGKETNYNKVHKIASEGIMKLQSLRSKLTGYAFSGCYISTKILCEKIRLEKPTIVHLHNINGYMVNIYKLLRFLQINNIPTVLSLHAEFMYTGGCGNAQDCLKWLSGCGNCPQKSAGRPSSKIFDRSAQEWKMMYQSLTSFKTLKVTTVSEWLSERARRSEALKDKNILTINNGLDTTIFKYTEEKNLIEEMSHISRKIMLHVTPDFTNPLKGGSYVIDIANRLKDLDVVILIIGYNGDEHNLPHNVITIKHLADQEQLAQYYSAADVTLLTSKSETYSMVCAESLSCGTPVIGFKAGGPETISLKSFSEFVEYGQTDRLEAVARKWLFDIETSKVNISKEAHNKYSDSNMNANYLELYRSI